jgi:hypothetical protein
VRESVEQRRGLLAFRPRKAARHRERVLDSWRAERAAESVPPGHECMRSEHVLDEALIDGVADVDLAEQRKKQV